MWINLNFFGTIQHFFLLCLYKKKIKFDNLNEKDSILSFVEVKASCSLKRF